jgi:hypothetical protein
MSLGLKQNRPPCILKPSGADMKSKAHCTTDIGISFTFINRNTISIGRTDNEGKFHCVEFTRAAAKEVIFALEELGCTFTVEKGYWERWENLSKWKKSVA